MSGTQFYLDNLDGGSTVTLEPDGTVNVSVPAGNPPVRAVEYSGGAIPTIAAGSIGLLVDTVAGSVASLPANYVGYLYTAVGSSTVSGAPSEDLKVFETNAAGPVTLVENGGAETPGGAPSDRSARYFPIRM